MNLLADEGVDRPVVERLRQDGHDVLYVAESSPGVPDEEVLQQANTRSAVLLTADKDFGELVFRQGLDRPGSYPAEVVTMDEARTSAFSRRPAAAADAGRSIRRLPLDKSDLQEVLAALYLRLNGYLASGYIASKTWQSSIEKLAGKRQRRR